MAKEKTGGKSGEAGLTELRQQIDAIDDALLKLLIERVGLVEKVGEIKHKGAKAQHSIIRPGREASMIRRMVKESEGKLSPTAVAQLWRIIISSACCIEEESHISTLASHETSECYWMAREYFGAFTPISKRPTTMEVVKDVVEKTVTVGVLPVWDEASPKPWWVRVAETEKPPMVFAKLPFLRAAPSKKTPVLCVGYVEPEETGDDHTLWVVTAEETISYDAIETALKDATQAPLSLVHHYRQVGTPTQRFYLVDVKGFRPAGDAAIEKFTKVLNKLHARATPASIHVLGCYATTLELVEGLATDVKEKQAKA